MKTFVVFLLIIASPIILNAQAKNCTQPIPNPQYQQKLNQIKNRPAGINQLQFALQIIKSYCFSSNQIKEIASLFENDYDRLEFAKEAYNSVFDKENFYDVYDAFLYYSVVFRLHDYVQNQKGLTNNQNEQINTNITIEFPNYTYPEFNRYHGNKNCSGLINVNSFNQTVSKIYLIKSEKEKTENAIFLINDNCFPTEYLMKISSLLSTEESKLKFAQQAINSVYDLDNYVEMKQIFNTPGGRSKFMNFLSTRDNQNNLNNRCRVSDNEFNNILLTIKNEKFNTTKLNTAKHLIQANKCFTSFQIKKIVELFNYENSRLDIAKQAYDFTIDQKNYTIVSQALEFENSKKQLLEFIKAKDTK